MKYAHFVIIILIVCFFSKNETFAQAFAENYWHSGTVFLEEGDTLSGTLKFSLQDEVVQIETATGLKTLTARNAIAFYFLDRFEQRERHYYALPYPKVSNYPTPTYFELIMQGEPITLLCRESMVVQTIVNNNPYVMNPGIPMRQNILKREFYFLYKSGKIVPFNGTKKGLLYLLKDRERDIKLYIKENRVNFESKQDMASIINYFNSKKR